MSYQTTGTSSPRDAVSEERVLELVDARWQHALRYNRTLFAKVKTWTDQFRGTQAGRISQFRNNVNIPFTFAMIESFVARLAETTFGAWPIVGFEGYAPEDVPLAKKREVLISAQMKDCDSVRKANDFYLQAAICGTGIARYGWKNITRKTRYRKMETIAPGMRIPVIYEADLTKFNGPDWVPVDRLDFGQQPGIKWIEDMDWVCHRYYRDWDALMEESIGEYTYFNAAGVRRLKEYPLVGAAADEFTSRRLMFRNDYDYMVRANERFAKPVEIIEMHGLVPSEFAKDGIRERCIAIANNRVVIKNSEAQLPSGEKPFISYCPQPDPYGFDGISKAEIAEKMQRTADRIANQKLDALDLLIDPMYVASNSANLNTQNLFSRAGRILLVDGAANEDNIRALQPDMRGLQAAYTEIAQLFSFMQLGTGETDVLLGVRPQGDETARGVLARQENALSRSTHEAKLADENFVEKLANAFVELDRYLLPVPYQVKILGSMATTNPITGLPYPDQPITMEDGDLVPDYRARAVGSTQMLGKGIARQDWLSILQVIGSNPIFQQILKWPEIARETFTLFGKRNVNDFIVNQIPLVNQMAAMQQGGGANGPTLQQPLDQLAAGTLGPQAQSPIGMIST